MVGGCTVALMLFLMAVIPPTGIMADVLAMDWSWFLHLLFFSESYFSFGIAFALCFVWVSFWVIIWIYASPHSCFHSNRWVVFWLFWGYVLGVRYVVTLTIKSTVSCIICFVIPASLHPNYETSSFIVECTSTKVSWRLLLRLFSNIVFVLIGKLFCCLYRHTG